MLASKEVTVKVKLPKSILFDYGLSEKQASTELLRAFVLSLYRRDKISSGKAAKLLKINRFDFIRMLDEERIPYLDYTPEELDAEIQAAQQWKTP